MAVYNGMPYLPQAVESILHQTYKNFEFIIVDDASSDSTWLYLASLKDRRIKLIKNRQNTGLAASLNIALRHARGDYVARMDADDISLSQRLEIQVNFMLKNPSVDLCGSWVDLINESGEIIGKKKYPTSDNSIKKALTWYPPIVHPTFMAKAIFFKDLRGYDPNFDLAEEYELLLRGMKKFKMANIPQKLLLWRLWAKRRSRTDIIRMTRADLNIKIEAYKKGYFGFTYLAIIGFKFFTTYVIPSSLKILVTKLFKLA